MKVNKWTLGLAALGLVSIPLGTQAEEKMNNVWTALSSTTLSGYVNTSAHWNTGTGNERVPAATFREDRRVCHEAPLECRKRSRRGGPDRRTGPGRG